MREYDDDIRLYTPVLQRIIILVAVIVAVPVVMWTITAFVRDYIAPPRAPTFQRTAMLPPPADTTAELKANPAPSPALDQAQVAASAAQAAIVAAGPLPQPRAALLDIKKPPAGDQAQAPAGGTANSLQVASTSPSSTAMAPSMAAPAAPVAAITPSGAMQNAMPTATDKADSQAPSADHAFAWPSSPAPTSTNAGTASGASVAAQETMVSSDTADDAVPAGKPLAGRIPLPRHRPNVVAMMQTGMMQTSMAQPGARPNSVPLPRARPADAPEPAPEATINEPDYDRGSAH